MRRILPWTFVLLLVLRGLLGSAMAAGSVPAFPVPVPVLAASAAAPGTPLQAHIPTADHASHGADAGQPGHGPDGAALPACQAAAGPDCPAHIHPPTCTDCDICHTALLAPSALSAPPAHTTGPVRPLGSAPFASAQAAPALKPPIF